MTDATVDATRPPTPFDRTPLAVAVLAGVLLGVAVAAMPEGAGIVLLVTPFAVAAAIDVKTRRIPNALTLGTLALALTAAILDGQGGNAVMGAVAALATGIALQLLARGSFGFGDVKLMAGAGATAGLTHVADFLFAMALTGGAFALLLVLIRRTRRTTMPYGPAIAAGTLVVLLVR